MKNLLCHFRDLCKGLPKLVPSGARSNHPPYIGFAWFKSSSLNKWDSLGLKQFWHLLLLKMLAWNFRHGLSLEDMVEIPSWSYMGANWNRKDNTNKNLKLRNSSCVAYYPEWVAVNSVGALDAGPRCVPQWHKVIPNSTTRYESSFKIRKTT